MTGSVIKYAGRRGVVWRIKYLDANGKQVMETVGAERDGMTEKRAREILENRRVAVREHNYAKPRAVSFAAAAEDWFESECVARNWKPGTIGQYRRSREHLEEHFRGPVGAITSSRIIEYRDDVLVELSPATVSRHLTVLNLILVWAADNELVEHNPTIKYPRVRQRKGVALRPEQVRLLERSFDDEQARTRFLTHVFTELRKSELEALRWRDVDLVEKRLRVEDSKTETGERSIALGSWLVSELVNHLERTPFKGADERVFTSSTGGKYRADEFKKALERAFETAGIPWPEGFRRCHDLRVTGATNDVRAGMDNARLQAKLGHTDFRTTQRYINLAGVVFSEDAEALERRMLGVESSTDLSAPESTEEVTGA